MAIKLHAGPRGRLVGVLVAAASAASLGISVAPAAAQETLAADCGPRQGIVSAGAGGNARFAQPFSPSISGSLTRAQVDVQKGGSAGSYIVSINETSGGVPTNTVLASATIPDSFPDGAAILDAIFSSPPAVTAGQTYAVVVTRPGSNILAAGIRNGDCPSNLFLANSGSSAFSPIANDLVFAAFVTPPSPPAQPEPEPEPQAKADGTLTLDANKGKVERGHEIELSGQIDTPSDEGCESGRAIELQRHKKNDPDSAFHTFTTVPADAAGNFRLRKPVGLTKVYRAVVVETARCDDETSNTVKVRVQKKKAAQEA